MDCSPYGDRWRADPLRSQIRPPWSQGKTAMADCWDRSRKHPRGGTGNCRGRRQIMSRLSVLVLAQGANPDSICGPLIAYSQAQALARLHDVTLVIDASNGEAVRRKQDGLHSVEVIRLPLIDRAFAWSVKRVFKNNYNNQLLQAFIRPFSLLFEWQAWRQMRARIKDGEFDVVLRLLPVSMINVSPFAFFLRNGPIQFVIGPINGGLPWLPGFRQT